MNICRFEHNDVPRVGIASNGTMLDLTALGIEALTPILESEDPVKNLRRLVDQKPPSIPLSEVTLLAPLERQEVWAAGVTYLRSKTARMEESNFSANAYDRVYAAERPELFFKALAEKVVAPGRPVGIRRDARWNVPEPELVLILNSRGRIVGYSIGNDMSSRDIEGENLLYLPQAKIYAGSCAVGPWITLGPPEAQAREWSIRATIERRGATVFAGGTSVGQIKRGFEELTHFLFRSQVFPHGAALFTGTGIVPPDTFTLEAGDEVAIEISGIGILQNPVQLV
jgi:2-dehydro-3-deoxy-D-arabinonate dehydratase